MLSSTFTVSNCPEVKPSVTVDGRAAALRALASSGMISRGGRRISTGRDSMIHSTPRRTSARKYAPGLRDASPAGRTPPSAAHANTSGNGGVSAPTCSSAVSPARGGLSALVSSRKSARPHRTQRDRASRNSTIFPTATGSIRKCPVLVRIQSTGHRATAASMRRSFAANTQKIEERQSSA